MSYESWLAKGARSFALPDPDDELDPRKRDWRADMPGFARPRTPVGRGMDVIQRFNYAAANATLEAGRIIRDEKADNPLDATWDVMKAYGRGFSGQEKIFFENWLDEAEFSKDWNPWVKKGVGLALDIGTDPLTYLTSGLTKAGRLGKLAALADDMAKAGKIPGWTTAAQKMGKLIPTADMAGRQLRRMTKLNAKMAKWQGRYGKDLVPLIRAAKGGRTAQIAGGQRGLINFMGKPLVKGANLAKFQERLPYYLLGHARPRPPIGGPEFGVAYRWIDENAPLVRKIAKSIGERFTPGNTLDPGLREIYLGSARYGRAMKKTASDRAAKAYTLAEALLKTRKMGFQEDPSLLAKMGKLSPERALAQELVNQLEHAGRAGASLDGDVFAKQSRLLLRADDAIAFDTATRAPTYAGRALALDDAANVYPYAAAQSRAGFSVASQNPLFDHTLFEMSSTPLRQKATLADLRNWGHHELADAWDIAGRSEGTVTVLGLGGELATPTVFLTERGSATAVYGVLLYGGAAPQTLTHELVHILSYGLLDGYLDASPFVGAARARDILKRARSWADEFAGRSVDDAAFHELVADGFIGTTNKLMDDTMKAMPDDLVDDIAELLAMTVDGPNKQAAEMWKNMGAGHDDFWKVLNPTGDPSDIPLSSATLGVRVGDAGIPDAAKLADDEWKGLTKVVDETGKPRRVYHGTTGEWDKFDMTKVSGGSMAGPGIYFAEDPRMATEFAGWKSGDEAMQSLADRSGKALLANIRPAYLDIRNPLDMFTPLDPNFLREARKAVRKALKDPVLGGDKGLIDFAKALSDDTLVPQFFQDNSRLSQEILYRLSPEDHLQIVQAAGFDGIRNTVIIPVWQKGGKMEDLVEWVAFNTGQRPLPPRWRSMVWGENATDSTPATRKPNSRYGAISPRVAQKSPGMVSSLSSTRVLRSAIGGALSL